MIIAATVFTSTQRTHISRSGLPDSGLQYPYTTYYYAPRQPDLLPPLPLVYRHFRGLAVVPIYHLDFHISPFILLFQLVQKYFEMTEHYSRSRQGSGSCELSHLSQIPQLGAGPVAHISQAYPPSYGTRTSDLLSQSYEYKIDCPSSRPHGECSASFSETQSPYELLLSSVSQAVLPRSEASNSLDTEAVEVGTVTRGPKIGKGKYAENWTKEDEVAEKAFLANGVFDRKKLMNWRFWFRLGWWCEFLYRKTGWDGLTARLVPHPHLLLCFGGVDKCVQ